MSWLERHENWAIIIFPRKKSTNFVYDQLTFQPITAILTPPPLSLYRWVTLICLWAVVLWSTVSSFPEFSIHTSSLWPNGTMIFSTWPRIEVAFQFQQQLLETQHTQLNSKSSQDFGLSQTMFFLFGCSRIQTYWDFSYCGPEQAYELQLPTPLKKSIFLYCSWSDYLDSSLLLSVPPFPLAPKGEKGKFEMEHTLASWHCWDRQEHFIYWKGSFDTDCS